MTDEYYIILYHVHLILYHGHLCVSKNSNKNYDEVNNNHYYKNIKTMINALIQNMVIFLELTSFKNVTICNSCIIK